MNKLIDSKFASIGVAFYNEVDPTVSPEDAIISFLLSDDFPKNKRLMGLLLVWLKEFSKYVQVEYLKHEMTQLNYTQIATLGAIATKCVEFKDFRWRNLEATCRKKIKNVNSSLYVDDDEISLQYRGVDKVFEKFKIIIPNRKEESEKKLRSRDWVLSKNIWIKNRLLFGVNPRADIATVLELKSCRTAYAAAKILNISKPTAYRNWDDLKMAGWAS